MTSKKRLLTLSTMAVYLFSLPAGVSAAPSTSPALAVRKAQDVCCYSTSDCTGTSDAPYTCCHGDPDRCNDGTPFTTTGYCIISNRPFPDGFCG